MKITESFILIGEMNRISRGYVLDCRDCSEDYDIGWAVVLTMTTLHAASDPMMGKAKVCRSRAGS